MGKREIFSEIQEKLEQMYVSGKIYILISYRINATIMSHNSHNFNFLLFLIFLTKNSLLQKSNDHHYLLKFYFISSVSSFITIFLFTL